MKRIISSVLFLLAWFVCGAPVLAQVTPRILRFEPAVMEIDTVRYDKGPVHVRFVCTNISDKDVTILDVHSQCGCAVPSFPGSPIKPGEKSHVDVTLNTSMLFAEQNRHLTVIATNGDYRKFNTITIHGYVDRGVTEEELKYPYELAPGIRSDVENLGMRRAEWGSIVEREITLLNNTDKEIGIGWSSPFINVEADAPETIAPHRTAVIRVVMDTRSLGRGPFIRPLYLQLDGRKALVLLKGAIE